MTETSRGTVEKAEYLMPRNLLASPQMKPKLPKITKK